jgi:hypothetical protein
LLKLAAAAMRQTGVRQTCLRHFGLNLLTVVPTHRWVMKPEYGRFVMSMLQQQPATGSVIDLEAEMRDLVRLHVLMKKGEQAQLNAPADADKVRTRDRELIPLCGGC